MNTPPFRLDDRSWLELLERSCTDPSLGLPGFPPDDVQRGVVGNAGVASLRSVFPFYQHIKQHADLTSGPVLDFGVGYGRIARFFLNDLPPDQLFGVDTYAPILAECGSLGHADRFSLIHPRGTLPFADQTFGVVYAYSVFTHLPEPIQDVWLQEIGRVLKPGGLFAATVELPRGFEYFASLNLDRSDLPPHARLVAKQIQHQPAVRTSLEQRGFAFVGGEVYGDAFMTADYVRSHWSRWFTIDQYLDDPARFSLAVVTARSPLQPDAAILARIRRVAAAIFRCDTRQFGAETVADDIDGWDSLSHTVFLLGLEREFGVRFDVARVAHLAKVGDLAREIERLTS